MKIIDITKILPGVAYPLAKPGLGFLQDAYKEAISELAKAFVGDDYAVNTVHVLYGCIKKLISGSNFSYTEGAIFYNGEIYFFPAVASLTVSIADVCTITTTADPTADPTTMTDGSPVDIHDVRQIVLTNETAVTNGAIKFNFHNYRQWHFVGGAGEPAFQNSWVNSEAGSGFNLLRFKRLPGNVVEIVGDVKGGVSGTVVFNIGTDYVASVPVGDFRMITMTAEQLLQHCYATITSAGDVRIIRDGDATSHCVFGGNTFSIDPY